LARRGSPKSIPANSFAAQSLEIASEEGSDVDREGDSGGFFIPFTIHSIKIVQVIIIDLWVKLST